MAKGKKSKSEGKKARIAEKKEKLEKKEVKTKKAKKLKNDYDSDTDDVDIETVLANYVKEQEQFLKVTEVSCTPPRSRTSATLIASPANSNELFLFGGEYFDGASITFFNDLYVYIINKDEWRLITSPNTPLPRSGHAWSRGGNSRDIYLFGGEFSSPKQGTFYHFWRFDPSTREWTRLDTKGKSPPARSGHRMTYYKNYIILFGGFQDTSQNTKYLADLWIYDTNLYVWYNPDPPSTQKPEARSSFSFLPHEKGAIVFGGYSRVKVTVSGKQPKGCGQSKMVYKSIVHQDCFFLRITQLTPDSPKNLPPKFHWERRKKPANLPNPPRAGATMAYHRNRGIMFGGVHDFEESEEKIESEFFNSLLAWNIERNRFYPLTLRKPKPKANQFEVGLRSGRKGKVQANEDDLLKNLAILEAGASLTDTDNIIVSKDEELMETLPQKNIFLELPHVRFNAQLTVQDDVLYIYGGTFEKVDREYTFDDMYAIDLCKLDGVRQIFYREIENWCGSDIEESEDESAEEEGNISSDLENLEEISHGDLRSLDVNGHLKARTQENLTPPADNNDMSLVSAESSVIDDAPDSIPTNPDNQLPFPRPFESRREFFQRTSTDWQELLITKMRWKGILPETLSVKEIKTKAFEMSEDQWWNCREEIMHLEDEQEAAGIGEVVTLSDKKEFSGIVKRR